MFLEGGLIGDLNHWRHTQDKLVAGTCRALYYLLNTASHFFLFHSSPYDRLEISIMFEIYVEIATSLLPLPFSPSQNQIRHPFQLPSSPVLALLYLQTAAIRNTSTASQKGERRDQKGSYMYFELSCRGCGKIFFADSTGICVLPVSRSRFQVFPVAR